MWHARRGREPLVHDEFARPPREHSLHDDPHLLPPNTEIDSRSSRSHADSQSRRNASLVATGTTSYSPESRYRISISMVMDRASFANDSAGLTITEHRRALRFLKRFMSTRPVSWPIRYLSIAIARIHTRSVARSSTRIPHYPPDGPRGDEAAAVPPPTRRSARTLCESAPSARPRCPSPHGVRRHRPGSDA